MLDISKQDLRGVELHSRATQGEALTAQEQRELDAWYDEQDRLEAEELGLTLSFAGQFSSHRADEIAALRQAITLGTQLTQVVEEHRELIRIQTAYFQHLLDDLDSK